MCVFDNTGGLFPIKVGQVCVRVTILEWWTLPQQGMSGVSVTFL